MQKSAFFCCLNLKKRGMGEECDREKEEKKHINTMVTEQGQSLIVRVSPLLVAVYALSLYVKTVGPGHIVVKESTTDASDQ